MAKKAISKLQTGGGKNHTRVIKMVRSEKTGGYIFKEEMVLNEQVNDWFK